MLVVDGRGDVVEPALLVGAQTDLDDDGQAGREQLSPPVRPAELACGHEDAAVVTQAVDRVEQRSRRAAGSHDERDLERRVGRAVVRGGEDGELGGCGGRHEERADVGGIRTGAALEVLAHGHVEGSQARREDRGVVDEAVEEWRERRP